MLEAVTIARSKGVDPKPVIEMLTSTLLNAPIYQSYGKRIVETNTVVGRSPIAFKDIGILRQTAQQAETPTPIADLLLNLIKSEAEKAQ